jgi:hypothetical protein
LRVGRRWWIEIDRYRREEVGTNHSHNVLAEESGPTQNDRRSFCASRSWIAKAAGVVVGCFVAFALHWSYRMDSYVPLPNVPEQLSERQSVTVSMGGFCEHKNVDPGLASNAFDPRHTAPRTV